MLRRSVIGPYASISKTGHHRLDRLRLDHRDGATLTKAIIDHSIVGRSASVRAARPGSMSEK